MAVRSEDPYWTDNGQRFYVFKNVRQNFLITDNSQNWKIWRAWASSAGTYPNIYIGSNNGRVYVEGATQEPGFWANQWQPLAIGGAALAILIIVVIVIALA